MQCSSFEYLPRKPKKTVLYRVIADKERPQVVPAPNCTRPRELTAEEFEALYTETMAAEKLLQESGCNGLT